MARLTGRRIGIATSVVAAAALCGVLLTPVRAGRDATLPSHRPVRAAPRLAYDLAALPEPAPTAREAPPPSAFVLRRVLPIDRPFRHGDWVWDAAGAPADGPIVVTIDLAAQVLSVFRDGYEIGTAVILYGADEKPTPLGAFPITQKDARHVSSLYGAPMPYMLRLTDDGVTIHGSDVRLGAATHGCVGVPVAFARKLFGVAKVGDVVIVTDGRTMQLGDRIVRS